MDLSSPSNADIDVGEANRNNHERRPAAEVVDRFRFRKKKAIWKRDNGHRSRCRSRPSAGKP